MIKQSFNRDWLFVRSGGGALAGLLGGGVQPEPVDLPHDAEITTARDASDLTGSGNGFFKPENVHYTKTFHVDAKDADKIFTLEFEGVYQNAAVYVNNSYVGSHPYGYGNFYLDITPYLTFGADNTLKVLAKNGGASGRWYTGGGIYRNVNLMVADRVHIAADGVFLTTKELDDEAAVISVDTELENKGQGSRELALTVKLLDAEGNVAARDTMYLTLMEGAKGSYRQQLYVEDPQVWDVDHPYLYSYKAELAEGETILDTAEGSFGIRMIQLDARRGLRINGKTVKLAGGCLHHDCGITGTAEFPHAEAVRVANIKKAGFNAIRSSHYPMSRTLIEECDRQGLYVMDEFADVWTSTKVDHDYGMNMPMWWEYDTEMLVRKDYNHPSVILYSIGNEIPEAGNKFDVQWGKKLTDKIRSLDSSRFVLNSLNLMLAVMDKIPQIIGRIMVERGMDPSVLQGGGEPGEINSMMSNLGDIMAQVGNSPEAGLATQEAAGQVDITGYNYSAGRYESDHALHPNRVMVGSETNPGDLDVNWELVERLPYLIGDFDWTVYDYLGEAGIGRVTYGESDKPSFYASFPTKAAYCGDIDLLGDMRPVAYWRQVIWGLRKAPYIAVQDPGHHGQKVNMSQWRMTDCERSWTYTGKAGSPVKVEVYSDAEEIELLINGRSVGRAAVGTRKKAIADFETVYEPGVIEAVAYVGGKETGRDRLETAGDALHIRAAFDAKTVPADGSDIVYAELCLEDAAGNIDPEKGVPVSIALEGPGRIQGFGSADPESEENYFDTTARFYQGRLRAAIRGTGETGEIKVTFTSPGMEDVAIAVRAE